MNRVIKFRAWNGSEMSELHGKALEAIESPAAYAVREVMQFTGLLDKNGKEIYEGDILEYGGARNEVKHDPNLAMYHDIFGLAFSSLAGQSEVISNIYENPELLTKEKELGV